MFGLSRRERALKKATGALAEFYQVPHPRPARVTGGPAHAGGGRGNHWAFAAR